MDFALVNAGCESYLCMIREKLRRGENAERDLLDVLALLRDEVLGDPTVVREHYADDEKRTHVLAMRFELELARYDIDALFEYQIRS